MSKRVLVTGGAGFLGSHLCDRLIEAGHYVVCLDNFATGKAENIVHLHATGRFRLVRHDVCKPVHLAVGERYDEIYNLACSASPKYFQRNPISILRTSVLGALNLLDVARRTGATILQASTSEIYGSPLVHPQIENDWGNVNPIGPRACYDEGKRCAETLFFDVHRKHGVSIKVVRIFNTYGPRLGANDGRVVATFIAQALRGAPLTVLGDGQQTRSFCYVDDLVGGLIATMATPATVNGPINLGNPEEISILKLAHTVIELTGSTSTLTYRPLPLDDPPRRRPDITLAKEYLHWTPTTDLRTGLAATITSFKEGSILIRPH